MVSKNLILSKLQPFLNQQNIVVENQGVNDIITGILTTHNKYKKEYDKIYIYFVDDDIEETCRNIFQFLKDNVPYFIESNDFQFLKSPSAILSSKSDCKSYSLMSCGIADAILRNEKQDFEVCYRFASYDPFDKTPQHVFCVVKSNGKEYWIDPVLDRFNQRKQPYFYKDKNLNSMALVGLSGTSVGKYDPLLGYDTALMQTNTAQSSTGGTWTNILDSVLKSAPSIITATKGGTPISSGGGSFNVLQPPPPPQSTGISTNTLLMIGGVGLLAFFLLKRK